VLRSMVASFPYVRAFGSIEGWGTHLIGSMQPIPDLTPEQMVAAMPPAARADLVEWADTGDAAAYLGRVIGREVDVPRSLNPDPSVRVTDDRPFNEYFLLRRGLTSIDAEQQK